ncbi:hypothetical protein BJ684DRAFT_15480 [Piptocephalis cylindrospora]|uniref:Uncharacterized protein n=1 Tax=Piptocephalis cylindrospora TaxID=1907219 RepID=A0A4P9Y5E0_9FUNG|nr:hypothetical protein BJ684DRAFT_15480 [Piptocephalis cylindrospora]|eukprot:RKP14187.1 hypothetical protein BJ684DRAFT_15480 [Piptocephalis cylindrospora]
MSSPATATTAQSFLLLIHAIPLLSLPLSPLPLLVSLGIPFLVLMSLAATVLVTRRLAILDAEATVTECLLLRESARTVGDPHVLREIERHTLAKGKFPFKALPLVNKRWVIREWCIVNRVSLSMVTHEVLEVDYAINQEVYDPFSYVAIPQAITPPYRKYH